MPTVTSNTFQATVSTSVQWTANSSDPADFPNTGLPIIPGGAGWGMDQYAGSGRHSLVNGRARVRVIFVNNLDPGEGVTGSFGKAFRTSSTSAKTIVPQISGRVNRSGSSYINDRIVVTGLSSGEPYLTYAGQCAPDQGLWTTGSTVAIYMPNVLLWHLGHMAGQDIKDPPVLIQDGELAIGDLGYAGHKVDNILVANYSCLYARDGALQTWPDFDRTMDNIGLWQNSYIHGLEEAWGPTLAQDGRADNHGGSNKNSDIERTNTISMKRCFYGHTKIRTPRFFSRRTDLCNNVHFHFTQGIQCDSRGTQIKFNIRHNVFVPMGGEQNVVRISHNYADYLAGSEFYLGNNTEVGPLQDIRYDGSFPHPQPLTQVFSEIQDVVGPGYNATPATSAQTFFNTLANHVGVKPLQRLSRIQDVLDQCNNRINATGTGYGDYIGGEDEVGGIPTLTSTLVDHTVAGAHNGGVAIPQPDANKTAHADGWTGDYDIMPSGYTRLEEWLHHMNDLCMPTGWDQ